jgi:5-(carboxyamino)imidazole ribonucleotide synthase
MERPLLPGGTIGILGGGQLGRMSAIAARRMGYKVKTFDPSARTGTSTGFAPESDKVQKTPG